MREDPLHLTTPCYLYVHLYDTFTRFPENSFDVKLGQKVLGPQYRNFREAVETNIKASGVQHDVYRNIEGPVEDTLRSGYLATTKRPLMFARIARGIRTALKI